MKLAKIERPSKRLLEDLKRISSATAWGVLSSLGINSTFMKGIFPLKPGIKMVGPAQTLHYLPLREDMQYTPEEFRKSAAMILAEETQPGDVIVVDSGGPEGYGGMGDIMITGFTVRGAAGMVFNGSIRDSPYVRTLKIPVFCRGAQPSTTPRTMPVAANVMISCGGVLVCPGDILIGDDDGVVVIPKERAEEAAELGLEREKLEGYARKLLEAGKSLSEVYPPKREWLDNPPL